MKNILQIMNYAAPYRGNFIASIECLEKHWKNEGNMVFIFPAAAKNVNWMSEFINKGNKVYFVNLSFFAKKIKWSNVKKLNSIIKKEKIELIHTHFIEANFTLFLSKKLFFPSIRIVANLHNHYEPKGKTAKIRTWVMKHTVNFFIGDSESVSQSAYSVGVKKNKVETILNSIQFNRLNDYKKEKISDEKYLQTVLMFGYPWHRKGVDVVAKAVEQINSKFYDRANLLIAMSGRHEDTKKGIEKTLGYFPDWVKLLPPREDLATYYNNADVFVSAGREEGLSYSPIEAAYCECMVVCSNIPGNPLDIPQISIYDVEDHKTLERHLEEIFHFSDKKKQEIKLQQRFYVTSKYDVDKWAEKVIKCY